MLGNNIDEKMIAKKIIMNSLKIEESLIGVLKAETRILNRKKNENIDYYELEKINRTIKYTIYIVTSLDERIQKALDILRDKT